MDHLNNRTLYTYSVIDCFYSRAKKVKTVKEGTPMHNYSTKKLLCKFSNLLIALSLSLFIFSCQRELYFDNEPPNTARYSINCVSPAIAGIYVQGDTVAAGNTVTLLADVIAPGSYDIVSTANGIKLTARGRFTAAGAGQPIIFIASGTPLAAGNTVFVIPSGCTLSIPILTTAPQASFFLNCSTAVVKGGYIIGTALDQAINFITFTATVTAPGRYNITQTLNGITFTSSGIFTAPASAAVVRFAGSGTPTVAGVNNFTFGPNTCPLSILVDTINANGDFLVTDIGGITRAFNANLTGTFTNLPVGPSKLTIKGLRSNTSPEKLIIEFVNSNSLIGPGTYNNVYPQFPNPFAVATYTDASGGVWETTGGTFTITALSALTASGSFDGVLTKLNSGGPPQRLNLTVGSFRISF